MSNDYLEVESSDEENSGEPDGEVIPIGAKLQPLLLGLVALSCLGAVAVVTYLATRTAADTTPSAPLALQLAQAAPQLDDAAAAGQTCGPPSAKCQEAVDWAVHIGIHRHPDWYPSLNAQSSADAFQAFLAEKRDGGCDCAAAPPAPLDATMGTYMPCTDQESCLKVVDAFLDRLPRATYFQGGAYLLQSFGANTQGGGSCGNLCRLPTECPDFEKTGRCRFDVYDNALAAIYLTKRGRLAEAQHILDAFVELLYPEKEVPGVSFGARDGVPSKRYIALLAASYTPTRASASSYWGDGVADGAVDTGNNAWVAMALTHYSAAANKPCYALVARDILHVLKLSPTCDDSLQGFVGRLQPYPRRFRSTEHNIDVYALSYMLGDTEAQARARTFVNNMFAYTQVAGNNHFYSIGVDGQESCASGKQNSAAVVDAQFWNALADADGDSAKLKEALKFAVQSADSGGFVVDDVDVIGNNRGIGKGESYKGLRFSSYGKGAQWENTASAVMGLIHFVDKHGDLGGGEFGKSIDHMRASLKTMLGRYGSVLGSLLGGNMDAYFKHEPNAMYPGGTDTGLGWTYLRYPHLASTAWTGLLLLHQADSAKLVNATANPYSPPSRVPDLAASLGAAAQCLPFAAAAPGATPAPGPAPAPAPEGGGGSLAASCKAHAGCATLAGNCCPTATGVRLGCCGAGPACHAHPACARLRGDCCPTADGVRLGCCSP